MNQHEQEQQQQRENTARSQVIHEGVEQVLAALGKLIGDDLYLSMRLGECIEGQSHARILASVHTSQAMHFLTGATSYAHHDDYAGLIQHIQEWKFLVGREEKREDTSHGQ